VAAGIESEKKRPGGNPITFVEDVIARGVLSERCAQTLSQCYQRLNHRKNESIIQEMFARAVWMTGAGMPFAALSGPRFDAWIGSVRNLRSDDKVMSTRVVVDTSFLYWNRLSLHQVIRNLMALM